MVTTAVLRQPGAEQSALLAGTLTHLSRYLQSGCPRSAELARLLLVRLGDVGVDADLQDSCAALEQALAESAAPRQRVSR